MTDVAALRLANAGVTLRDFGVPQSPTITTTSTGGTGPSVSYPIALDKGGTAATTAAGARTNLGLGSIAVLSKTPTGADFTVDWPATVLTTTGVTAGSYGDSTHVGQFTVDAKGRLTAAANVAISGIAAPPTIVGTVQGSNQASFSLTHTITLPTGYAIGDVMCIVFTSESNTAVTGPTGFTNQGNGGGGATPMRQQFYTRVLDGSESWYSSGSPTTTITTAGTVMSSAIAFAVNGASGTVSIASYGTTSASSTMTPPSLTPSSTDAFLWVATAGWIYGNTDLSAYPSNFTQSQTKARSNNASGTGTAVAMLGATASTESPNTYTAAAGVTWLSTTVAFAPSITSSPYLRRANNLSDVSSASTARTNIGAVSKTGDSTSGAYTGTGSLSWDGSANNLGWYSGRVSGTLNQSDLPHTFALGPAGTTYQSTSRAIGVTGYFEQTYTINQDGVTVGGYNDNGIGIGGIGIDGSPAVLQVSQNLTYAARMGYVAPVGVQFMGLHQNAVGASGRLFNRAVGMTSTQKWSVTDGRAVSMNTTGVEGKPYVMMNANGWFQNIYETQDSTSTFDCSAVIDVSVFAAGPSVKVISGATTSNMHLGAMIDFFADRADRGIQGISTYDAGQLDYVYNFYARLQEADPNITSDSSYVPITAGNHFPFYFGPIDWTTGAPDTATRRWWVNQYGSMFTQLTTSAAAGIGFTVIDRSTSATSATGIPTAVLQRRPSSDLGIGDDGGSGVAGQNIGRIQYQSWDNTTNVAAVGLYAYTTDAKWTHSPQHTGAEFRVYTTPTGTSGLTLALTVGNDGISTAVSGLATTAGNITANSGGLVATDPTSGVGLNINTYGNAPTIWTRRTQGTSGSPTKVASTNRLGEWAGYGYDDTGTYRNTATIDILTTEDYVAELGRGSQFLFKTSPSSTADSASSATLDATNSTRDGVAGHTITDVTALSGGQILISSGSFASWPSASAAGASAWFKCAGGSGYARFTYTSKTSTNQLNGCTIHASNTGSGAITAGGAIYYGAIGIPALTTVMTLDQDGSITTVATPGSGATATFNYQGATAGIVSLDVASATAGAFAGTFANFRARGSDGSTFRALGTLQFAPLGTISSTDSRSQFNLFVTWGAGATVTSANVLRVDGTDGTIRIPNGLQVGAAVGTAPTAGLDVTGGIALLTGSLTITNAGNIVVGTGTGTKIGTGTTQKIGFWNAAPIAQYSTTGTTTGYSDSGATTVHSAGTFTGNTGSTAYTIGDIVRALKLTGIMAA